MSMAVRMIALMATGVIVIGAVGFAVARSDDGDDGRPVIVDPVPSGAKNLDLAQIVDQGSIGDWKFVLAPGTGAFAGPRMLCLAAGRAGDATNLVCSTQSDIDQNGGVASDLHDGTREVWGVAPLGTSRAVVWGASLPLNGRFFRGTVPPSAASITFVTDAGNRSLSFAGR